MNGSIGLVGVTSGFTLGLPKSLLPIYTLSANWAFTPKLALNASASRTISPPTTVIANAETSYDAAVSLAYQLTPKMTVTAGGSVGYSNSSFTSATADGISPFFVNTQKTYSLECRLDLRHDAFPVGRAERLI